MTTSSRQLRLIPDETDRAHQLIDIWSTWDTEAQDSSLARLIAASVHTGPGSPLARFAGTGEIDPEPALAELNLVQVPLEREAWVDVLGRHILGIAGDDR